MLSSPLPDGDSGSLPWIKICGNLRPEDAFLVASYGPEFMGWIFSPFSPRRIARAVAAKLIRRIREKNPRIKHAGVFAGNPLLDVIATDRYLRDAKAALDFLQITEGSGFIQHLRMELLHNSQNRRTSGGSARPVGTPSPVIPVIRPTSPITEAIFTPTAPAPLWILDRFDPTAKGGTGQRIPPEFFDASLPPRFPFLLAGGINPGNAVAALRESRARGIDVSSGLELYPGVKDPKKIEALFAVLRKA